MKRIMYLLPILVLLSGCHSDIVCTDRLKQLDYKCVYVQPLEAQNPHMGKVLSDIIVKELIRHNIEICSAESANVVVTGAAFMTERSASDKNLLGASALSDQAIETVSLTVKDADENMLASASYDNCERYTASKLGKELGRALAEKLK